MRASLTKLVHASLVASALLACSHARHVGAPDDQAEPRSEAPPRPATVRPHPGHPAVSSTPEGLMAPGSVKRIQEALRGEGLLERVSGTLDGPTSAALRRYQQQQDLPATGAPDRETLRKLGIPPEEVYRNVAPGKEQAPPAGS